MDILIKALLSVSIVLNIFLAYKVVMNRKGTGYIVSVLEDIRNLNSARRIHVGLKYKSLKRLSTELNMLFDKFMNALDEKQMLEVSHKLLISNISHDIRTPLTSLLGFIEVLKRDDKLTSQERKDYLDIIHTKGQFLYKMIQDFFELSKLESDDTEIKLEKMDLLDVVSEVLASFYQDFAINGITPEIQLPDGPLHVWGNNAMVERVLQNLITNALKYGSSGGIIGITVRKDDDRSWVDIWDNGQGIPEKDIPFLFNRLYTVETSRNDKLRGSGLGLAIAKQLVERHKGEIRVVSIPDERTTFSFCLQKC